MKAVDNVFVTAEINPEPLLVADDVALGSASYLVAVSLAGLDLQLLGGDAIGLLLIQTVKAQQRLLSMP